MDQAIESSNLEMPPSINQALIGGQIEEQVRLLVSSDRKFSVDHLTLLGFSIEKYGMLGSRWFRRIEGETTIRCHEDEGHLMQVEQSIVGGATIRVNRCGGDELYRSSYSTPTVDYTHDPNVLAALRDYIGLFHRMGVQISVTENGSMLEVPSIEPDLARTVSKVFQQMSGLAASHLAAGELGWTLFNYFPIYNGNSELVADERIYKKESREGSCFICRSTQSTIKGTLPEKQSLKLVNKDGSEVALIEGNQSIKITLAETESNAKAPKTLIMPITELQKLVKEYLVFQTLQGRAYIQTGYKEGQQEKFEFARVALTSIAHICEELEIVPEYLNMPAPISKISNEQMFVIANGTVDEIRGMIIADMHRVKGVYSKRLPRMLDAVWLIRPEIFGVDAKALNRVALTETALEILCSNLYKSKL